VQLVDEYDQIHKDLFLFKAYSRSTILARLKELRTVPGTYSITVKKGVVDVISNDPYITEITGAEDRVQAQLAFIEPFAKNFDNLEAAFNIHDYPRSLLYHEHRRELQERVEDNDCEHVHIG
jgi:hypothetical protein